MIKALIVGMILGWWARQLRLAWYLFVRVVLPFAAERWPWGRCPENSK